MTDTDHAGAPIPPDSLPKYLAEGVPKQDTETLEDVRTSWQRGPRIPVVYMMRE